MLNQVENLSNNAMKLTGADVVFDRMLDGVIAQVRRAMGVPAAAPGAPSADPATEAEFQRLRERLTSFFPEYQTIYQQLITHYVGAQFLPQVVGTLMSEPMRRYFHAMREMEPELISHMQRLGERMGRTTVYEQR
jgi:hypothetical protein